MFFLHTPELRTHEVLPQLAKRAEHLAEKAIFLGSDVIDHVIGWNDTPAHDDIVTQNLLALNEQLPPKRRDAFEKAMIAAQCLPPMTESADGPRD